MPTVKPPGCTIATPPGDPKHAEELLDEAIWESFPASDPVAVTIDHAPEERARQSNLDRKDREANETQPPTGDLVGRRPGNR